MKIISKQLVHLRQLRNCLQMDRQKDNNKMHGGKKESGNTQGLQSMKLSKTQPLKLCRRSSPWCLS